MRPVHRPLAEVDPSTLLSLALLALVAAVGCGAHEPSHATRNPTEAPAAEAAAEAPLCAADNPFCNPSAEPTSTVGSVGAVATSTPVACGQPAVALQPAGVNIMLAVDGAASVKKHWGKIQQAIRALRERQADADIGLHVFWSDGIPFDFLQGGSAEAEMALNTTNHGCVGLEGRVLEPGMTPAETLLQTLGEGPEGGVIVDTYQVSPLIDALASYLTPESRLGDPTRTNYLVVFTNGHDNCFGSAFIQGADRKRAYQKLGIELDKRNIRLVPVGLDPPPADSDPLAFTPPFEGANFESMTTNYLVLEEMLAYGGSDFTEVPRIDSAESMESFLTEVGQKFNNCRFQIPQDLDSGAAANPFELTFSINDQVVPRDRHRAEGWDFVSGGTTQVEFYGQSCQALQARNTVAAKKSCNTDVCGTSAVGVSTKPRNILLLLDSSQSRTECTVEPFECFFADGADPNRPLAYWDVVLQSLGDALIAPVNEDVNFGMQFFPSKNAEMFTCDVATAPEIPPAQGQQLSIMRAMLEKTPLGLSPVVGVMESVAANPGVLTAPDAVNAVVLLSDGGDNCTGAEQPEIVARLGAAAKQLFDQGARTFAVRYGPTEGPNDGRDEQLEAIVQNGGTARMGQTPSYIDAKTHEELIAALAAISEEISTCAFGLTNVGADVDKTNTNLYLNGEAVGFDVMGAGSEGWRWADSEQTTIELLGNACTTFKSNSRNNVFVEFGCEPVVLL